MLRFLKKDKSLNYIYSPYQSIQINGIGSDAEMVDCTLNETINSSNSVEIQLTVSHSNMPKNCHLNENEK